jgi:TonB-dependent receptor
MGTMGNPDLAPLESTNFDLAYENYYAEGSYFAVNYFRKNIDSFIGSSTTVGTTYGTLTDPSRGQYGVAAAAAVDDGSAIAGPVWATGSKLVWWNAMDLDPNVQWGGGYWAEPHYLVGTADDPLALIDITAPANSESGMVDGWEIALQHRFGDTGFGASVNATFVGGDIEADRYVLAEQVGLPGFGDSANFAAFYEDDKWTATFAVNQRGETFAGTEGQGHPIFIEKRYQVDMTASYNVSESMTVFAEARNITDEPVRLFLRYPEMIFLAQDHGPMYKFGVRARF